MSTNDIKNNTTPDTTQAGTATNTAAASTPNTTKAGDAAPAAAASTPKMVDLLIPIVPGVLEADVRLVHNGRSITVKRGVTVQVPIGHKMVYDRSQRLLGEATARARARAEAYKKSLR